MALKIRILLYFTFNTKSSQIPKTFLWPFSYIFGLVYSPLNSAKLSCSSEVTLKKISASLMCTRIFLGCCLNFFRVKQNYRKKVFYLALNFLPWEFLLVKKLDFEENKTTWYTTFKTDVIKVVLVFLISNFFC